ncbi:MAG TPA: hypothetical protein VGM88_09400 [Kofleriaceae bacterium]
MRRALLLLVFCSCSRDNSPGAVAQRGWHAHDLVLRAGEAAPSCAAAGPAMQAVLVEQRQVLLDAVALEADKDRVSEAADYIAGHPDDFPDLDDRTEAFAQKCGADPGVAAALRRMANPDQPE